MISEPLRTYLYPILTALVGVLVGYGVLSEDQAPLWIALGAAVLGTAGTELARSKVTPVAKQGK